MKPNEFAYWLQGYFELREEDKPLTREQWDVVINHINLVKKVLEGSKRDLADALFSNLKENSTVAFINWLVGILEAAATPELKVDLDAITPLVKKKLGEQFEHVIDKGYGIDPAVLHEVHSPASKKQGTKKQEAKKSDEPVEDVAALRKKLKETPYRPSDHYPSGGGSGTSYNC